MVSVRVSKWRASKNLSLRVIQKTRTRLRLQCVEVDPNNLWNFHNSQKYRRKAWRNECRSLNRLSLWAAHTSRVRIKTCCYVIGSSLDLAAEFPTDSLKRSSENSEAVYPTDSSEDSTHDTVTDVPISVLFYIPTRPCWNASLSFRTFNAHCLSAAARAKYQLRVVRPELTSAFAQSHDDGDWRCLCQIIEPAAAHTRQVATLPLSLGCLGLRSTTRTKQYAYWECWANSFGMFHDRYSNLANAFMECLFVGACAGSAFSSLRLFVPANVAAISILLAIIVQRARSQGCWPNGNLWWRMKWLECAARQAPGFPQTWWFETWTHWRHKALDGRLLEVVAEGFQLCGGMHAACLRLHIGEPFPL